MTTFTRTIPDDLLQKLKEMAEEGMEDYLKQVVRFQKTDW